MYKWIQCLHIFASIQYYDNFYFSYSDRWIIVDLICISLKGYLLLLLLSRFMSCPTLCDPIDGSPPGSPVPEILQARTLEWVAISFSKWKWKVKVKSLSRVWLFATPWTAAHQAPPSMGFSGQEYWSGVPSPSPKGLPRQHIKKQRHYFANKGLSSQGYGFSSNHVWMQVGP